MGTLYIMLHTNDNLLQCLQPVKIEKKAIDFQKSLLHKIWKIIIKPLQIKEEPIDMKIFLVSQRPRRLSIKEQEEVDGQIRELLQNGIIKPSKSKYASHQAAIISTKGNQEAMCNVLQMTMNRED